MSNRKKKKSFLITVHISLLPHENRQTLRRRHHRPLLTPLSGRQSPPLSFSLPSFSLFPSFSTSPPWPTTSDPQLLLPLIGGKIEWQLVDVIIDRSSQLSLPDNLPISLFIFPLSFSFLHSPFHITTALINFNFLNFLIF